MLQMVWSFTEGQLFFWWRCDESLLVYILNWFREKTHMLKRFEWILQAKRPFSPFLYHVQCSCCTIFGPGLCRSWAHCRSATAGGNRHHATCGIRSLTQNCGVKSESLEARWEEITFSELHTTPSVLSLGVQVEAASFLRRWVWCQESMSCPCGPSIQLGPLRRIGWGT